MNVNKYREPAMLDVTGRAIASAIRSAAAAAWANKNPAAARVQSLDSTPLAVDRVVEAIGAPVYVDDVTQYPDYNLQDTGWYVFARITPQDGEPVGTGVTAAGAAGYVVNTAENAIDLAVRFDVAAMAQSVVINWGDYEETFVFRATDLAVRNLDYMTTFYVYDISRYVTWEYAQSSDTTVVADKRYFQRNGDGYEPVELTAGDPMPTAYYERSESYDLTNDTNFVEGKTYYTLHDGVYSPATVNVGDAVTPLTYYEQTVTYAYTTDTVFNGAKTYYTLADGVYSPATVQSGAAIVAYYNHSKIHFEGMVPNVTYKLDELVDCPIEIALPDIPENGHGAWFEIQMRFNGTYSITLLPVTEVKIGTAQTQAQTAGINIVDLQYTAVNGVKMWTLLNTHSNIPTT